MWHLARTQAPQPPKTSVGGQRGIGKNMFVCVCVGKRVARKKAGTDRKVGRDGENGRGTIETRGDRDTEKRSGNEN